MVNTRYTTKNNLPEYKDTHGYYDGSSCLGMPRGVHSESYEKKTKNAKYTHTKSEVEKNADIENHSKISTPIENKQIRSDDIKTANVLNMHFHFYNNDNDQEYVFVKPSV